MSNPENTFTAEEIITSLTYLADRCFTQTKQEGECISLWKLSGRIKSNDYLS